ncbi:imelysin family protein [Halalkalibaculum sp. DA3122]|uniref:imelysin family protein n=1 Tax=Halalkalibaculum sp. DA3122 TaxID=3373607 RepID=UPI0037550D52
MRIYSTLLLSLFTITLVFIVASCSSSTSSDDEEIDFDRSAMLQNYGNNIILPAFENLQSTAGDLDAAASDFNAERTPEHLQALQSALKEMRLAWQDVSPFQFGPAESVLMRASLNTYPTDTEQVNENISTGEYTLGTIESRDASGLPTLGYLLHGVGESEEEILAMYSADTDAESRMTYLLDNVAFVKDLVDTTADEWREAGGNYIGTFLSENNGGTDVGSSLGMLINSLVLHYERFLRDGKIGIPAGVRSGVERPTATEAYYGGYSLELAKANLGQVEQIFTGGGGEGLDDNLEALGAGDLSEEIKTELTDAQTALGSLSDPLSQQIEQDNEPVLTSFEELQKIVTLLKADMTSVLGVTITYQDNDGD